MKRRRFLNISAMSAGLGLVGGACSANDDKQAPSVQSMTKDVVPISVEERKARFAKAQQLMKLEDMKALIMDAGTSMEYFTGIRWGASERTMVAIIPVDGDVVYVSPAFEVSRLNELIEIGTKVYGWEEDENPSIKIVAALKEAGITSGKIGIEEAVRFFILDGLQKPASQFTFVSGNPVTVPCRMIKSPAEIALMQKASDVTVAAIKLGMKSLQEGMMPAECAAVIASAHKKLGAVHAFALVLFGQSSAFPHGGRKPEVLKRGDIVLMDCGCEVENYESDITRTIVFGQQPSKRQLEVWNLEKKAQSAGFAAANIGSTCESVDAAARKVITDAGFGPDYKLPGLPHRTGHGIGLDGHEWGYIVKGNKQLLEPGMCFSIEPTISIVGEFGVRLEDCVHITENGPEWFSPTALSIDQPFGESWKV